MCVVCWHKWQCVRRTCPVLVHYSIVVNPCRPIRAPVAESYPLDLVRVTLQNAGETYDVASARVARLGRRLEARSGGGTFDFDEVFGGEECYKECAGRNGVAEEVGHAEGWRGRRMREVVLDDVKTRVLGVQAAVCTLRQVLLADTIITNIPRQHR